MNQSTSGLKRFYDAAALFALLNLIGVAGLATLLTIKGALNTEKLRQMVVLLRGAPAPRAAVLPAGGRAVAAPVEAPVRPAGAETTPHSPMDLEIVRRESERIKTELEQRLALNNSILLRVTAERENFKREREQAAAAQEAAARQRREEGFKKQVGIYEALAPKVAVEHLLAIAEPDEAATILVEMDSRKAKAIVEAAKRTDQKERMKVILQRVRGVAPRRSADLGDEEP